MSVSRAARMAFEFSDVGNIGRAPAELYGHGKTILAIGPDGPVVRTLFADTTYSDVSNSTACLITVDMNHVVQQVDTVLNEIS